MTQEIYVIEIVNGAVRFDSKLRVQLNRTHHVEIISDAGCEVSELYASNEPL